MGDAPKRQPTRTNINVVEKNVAPVREEPLRARPVARTQTPIGMPAPPARGERDRESYDDIEHVLQIERLERERAQLLAAAQDAKEAQVAAEAAAAAAAQDASQARRNAPTLSYPPAPIEATPEPRPAPAAAAEAPAAPPVGHHLRTLATMVGIFVAIAWNAFNSYRSAPERVEAVQARFTQAEKERTEAIEAATLEKQRTLQALRALECWGKHIRGGFQRQGLDIPSLPPGGIRVLKIAPDDPNKPSAPVFVVEEKCPDMPKLPPER